MKPASQKRSVEICILAGGLSSRMGRDKSRMQLGGKTLLQRIRSVAEESGLPVRIVRKDIVKRCGPLGGIYTALKSTDADAVLFLPCDMPFVTAPLLAAVLRKFTSRSAAVFTWCDDAAGFPFILRRDVLPKVEEQLVAKRFSVNALAEQLRAKMFAAGPKWREQLANLNTRVDWENAQNHLRNSRKNRSA